jgi:hypothetical protein
MHHEIPDYYFWEYTFEMWPETIEEDWDVDVEPMEAED